MSDPENAVNLELEAERHTHRKDNEYLLGEIGRLRAALAECAADFATNPGTVMSAQVEINREFQRRMEVAGAALATP